MRIIHTADWHIGRSIGDYSLLEDQRDYFSRFVTRAKELSPDALLISGDLYDRSVPSADAVTLLGDILSELVLRLHIPTFVIAGNHDSGERLEFASGMLASSGLYVSGRVERTIRKIVLSPGVNIYLMPYFEPYQIKMLYPDEKIHSQQDAFALYTADMLSRLDPSEINILLAHGFFSCGGISDEEVGGSEMADASPLLAFDYVALGHLHGCRTAGSEKIRYAGSPLRYSIDESAQEKCFLIVDLDPDCRSLHITKEEIPPLRQLRVLEGAFDSFFDTEHSQKTQDYIFVNLTDRDVILNAAGRLKSVFPNLLGMRYLYHVGGVEDPLLQNEEKIRSLSPPALFGEFYREVTGETLDPAQQSAVDDTFSRVKGGV